MKATSQANRPRPRVRRVMGRLLKAVDRSIRAADEARAARDELLEIAKKEEGVAR